jgi:hypothetical protein
MLCMFVVQCTSHSSKPCWDPPACSLHLPFDTQAGQVDKAACPCIFGEHFCCLRHFSYGRFGIVTSVSELIQCCCHVLFCRTECRCSSCKLHRAARFAEQRPKMDTWKHKRPLCRHCRQQRLLPGNLQLKVPWGLHCCLSAGHMAVLW